MTLYSRIGVFFLTSVVSVTAIISAHAGELPDKAGPDRTIRMFELFCYNQMPDIARIAQIARGNFTPLTGDELQKFQPSVKTDRLKAWKWRDKGAQYILAASQSVPDEAFKKEVPAFAGSIAYSCSFFPKNKDAPDDLLARVEKIMKRKADRTFDQKPFKVHSWSGESDRFLVQVFFRFAPGGKPGKQLSVVVYEKKNS